METPSARGFYRLLIKTVEHHTSIQLVAHMEKKERGYLWLLLPPPSPQTEASFYVELLFQVCHLRQHSIELSKTREELIQQGKEVMEGEILWTHNHQLIYNTWNDELV